jgi:pimeloyl-ACP methyl ester carboxylesterase
VALFVAATCHAAAVEPPPGEVPPATVVTIESADGVELDGRLFAGDDRRVVIFLHGFDGNQAQWWPAAQLVLERLGASALTFDFRGYGGSGGEFLVDDLVADVHAGIAFALAQGYESIVLVGGSMGGTAAIIAASEDPEVDGVFALSPPAQFGPLDAVAAVEERRPRLVLAAAREDVSGADSLRQLRDAAGLTTRNATMFDGTQAHGIALLESEVALGVRAYFLARLEEMWEE